MKADIVIGIDPDATLNGVARLDIADRKVWATTLSFPLTLDYIMSVKREAQSKGLSLLVVIEASWVTATNWHTHRADNARLAARKGYDVGRCHETGKKLAEMLDHLDITVKEQTPLKKIWRGPDGKITHDELTSFVKWARKRSNQEERDAVLLAWNESGLPIRITVTRKYESK